MLEMGTAGHQQLKALKRGWLLPGLHCTTWRTFKSIRCQKRRRRGGNPSTYCVSLSVYFETNINTFDHN